MMTGSDYVELLWTTFAEFPGYLFALILIDPLGRKKSMALQLLIFSLATLTLLGCGGMSKAAMGIALFVARGTAAGVYQTLYVYTPEVYPTNVRALAMGTHSACSRVGAMVTPYIAQVLLAVSLDFAIGVYFILGKKIPSQFRIFL